MPESVSFNEQLRLIEVRSFGELTLETWLESLNEIQRLSDREQCTRILVDVTALTSGPTIVEVFDTATRKLPAKLRFALVMQKGQSLIEETRFLETVCQNRGIQLLLFNDRPKALDWLNVGSS